MAKPKDLPTLLHLYAADNLQSDPSGFALVTEAAERIVSLNQSIDYQMARIVRDQASLALMRAKYRSSRLELKLARLTTAKTEPA